jgi:CheY-like chemotaxis protein
VDDNKDVADTEADLLQVIGYAAVACYDGRSALRRAEDFNPDVCLIDLHMPGMAGDELAVRLRDRADGHPPVLIAVTAMSNDESCRRITEAGFDLHLIKPVDPTTLIGAVRRLSTG